MTDETGTWRRFGATARAWWADEALRRRLGHVGHVLTGNTAASLLGFVAFALTARTLGPASYGMLALLHTYARAVERVVAFPSWQALIKYGAALEQDGDLEMLARLLKFGLLLDLAGAVAAWIVAVGLALAGAKFFGWSDQILILVIAYATILPFNLTGMPTAVLRLAGRFRSIAYAQVVNAGVRVLLCAVGFAAGAGLVYFAAVWAAMQILGVAILHGLARRELRRQGIPNLVRVSPRGLAKRFPDLWNFAWSTNLSTTLRMSAYELDTLLVGALAGAAPAGLYHLAKRVGKLAQDAGGQFSVILYPDVARLWAQGEIHAFRRAILQVETILFGLGIAGALFFFVAAEPLLSVLVGAEYLGAAPLLVVQMMAVTFVLTAVPLRVALLAMGRQSSVLGVEFSATVTFHLTALSLIPSIAALGGSVAHVALGAVLLAGFALRLFRDLNAQETAPAG